MDHIIKWVKDNFKRIVLDGVFGALKISLMNKRKSIKGDNNASPDGDINHHTKNKMKQEIKDSFNCSPTTMIGDHATVNHYYPKNLEHENEVESEYMPLNEAIDMLYAAKGSEGPDLCETRKEDYFFHWIIGLVRADKLSLYGYKTLDPKIKRDAKKMEKIPKDKIEQYNRSRWDQNYNNIFSGLGEVEYAGVSVNKNEFNRVFDLDKKMSVEPSSVD